MGDIDAFHGYGAWWAATARVCFDGLDSEEALAFGFT